jgi:type II secretion system protein N
VAAQRRAARAPGQRGIPRAAAVAGALALFAAFLALRFPYERLLPPLLEAVQGATGAEIEVAELRLGLAWRGPRVVAKNVALRWPSNPPLAFEALSVGPAWSLAWLRGSPRFQLDLRGAAGAWSGELGRDRLAGKLDGFDVGVLPWALLGTEPPLRGRLSGVLDLEQEDGVWLGSAQVAGTSGSVELAGLPVAIPYEALTAKLDLAKDRMSLPSARLEGPLVTASFAGSATAGAEAFPAWPIDLAVEIERIDPALGSYLGPLGIQLDPQGRTRVHVTGTLAAPFLSGATP